MQINEDQINRWAKAPSDTENEKCENAISSITDTLRSHYGNSITIIRQGSHHNRTNIRLDSDVDFAVVHDDYFFPDISNLSYADKELYRKYRSPADYVFSQFKTDLHDILQRKFGSSSVQRKNKCIKVTGNSYRINADVVPAYVHKRLSSYGVVESEGIEFVTDAGVRVKSFPEQHYKNGVRKNDDTNRAYKSVVRILKNIKNHFVDEGILTPETMPSFFIENLVWNVPKDYFESKTWREDIENIAWKIWGDMTKTETANKYAEISDLMWLFGRHTNRTHKQAEDFMLMAANLVKK